MELVIALLGWQVPGAAGPPRRLRRASRRLPSGSDRTGPSRINRSSSSRAWWIDGRRIRSATIAWSSRRAASCSFSKLRRLPRRPRRRRHGAELARHRLALRRFAGPYLQLHRARPRLRHGAVGGPPPREGYFGRSPPTSAPCARRASPRRREHRLGPRAGRARRATAGRARLAITRRLHGGRPIDDGPHRLARRSSHRELRRARAGREEPSAGEWPDHAPRVRGPRRRLRRRLRRDGRRSSALPAHEPSWRGPRGGPCHGPPVVVGDRIPRGHGLVEVVEDRQRAHLPAGRGQSTSRSRARRIHSFWVPRLQGKVDAIPGRTELYVRLQASQPGAYQGACAEFCGLQHARMRFQVVAEAQPMALPALARATEPQPAVAVSGD